MDKLLSYYQNSRIRSDLQFYFFWVVACLISISISIYLIGDQTNSALFTLQAKNTKSESRLTAKTIERFIDVRIKILQDLAQSPIVANAVMGAENSRENLTDFLDSYRFLGMKEETSLIDIAGGIVFSNSLSTRQYKNFNWFEQILNNRKEYAVVIEKSDYGRDKLEIAVPVLYGGSAEGILFVEFTVDFQSLIPKQKGSQLQSLILTNDYFSYSTLQQGIDYDFIETVRLGEYNIELSLYVPSEDILIEQKQIEKAIVLSILLSLTISFVILGALGKRLILNPFKHLAASENELRESEDRFLRAVNGSNDGIWDWNVQTNEIYFSGRVRELLQYEGSDFEELPNQLTTVEEIIHPEDKFNLQNSIEQHLKLDRPFDIELRLKVHTGYYRYFRARGRATRNEAGEALKMSGSLTDISDYKTAQLALKDAKEQNDLLAQAVESSPVGVSIVDPKLEDMPIVYVNDAFTEITGYAKEEVVGLNCRFLQGLRTSKEAVDKIRTAISTETELNVTLMNYRKDGIPFWNQLQISPVFDKDKILKAFVGVQQDITEKIELETVQKLAKEAAESANQAKSEFLASMSHEIRTPMNGVLGMLRLLQNSKLDKDQHHKVDLALTSAQSLLNLINDILDFSKVDAGKLELESIDFNLTEMLGKFIEAAAFSAQGKGIELILDLGGVKSDWINGDPGRIRQIVTNIVGNAIKFTKEGEVKLSCELIDFEKDKKKLNFEVVDTGIGIPKDKLSSLFDSFTQVDASTTRQYGGTGLGLAIAKKLTEMMGGEIRIESEVNKGSRFSFSLIVNEANSSDDFSSSDSGIKPGNSTDQSNSLVFKAFQFERPLDILVADGNHSSAQAIESKLAQWGHKVKSMVVTESEQVTSAIKESKYDLIYIDFSVLKQELKQVQELNEKISTGDARFILMTHIGSEVGRDELRDVGVHYHFPKPVINLDLQSSLNHIYEMDNGGPNIGIEVEPNFANSVKSKSLQSVRILLVEDNQINQFVAEEMLSDLGFSLVDAAANGIEALESLKSAELDVPYNIILMDCQMPEMDGYEATRQIRKGLAGQIHQNVKILAMTANAMRGDREKCLEAGMDDYISKPVEPKTLMEKIVTMLALDI